MKIRVYFKGNKACNLVYNMLGQGVVEVRDFFESTSRNGSAGHFMVFDFPNGDRLSVNFNAIEAVLQEAEA